LHCGGLMVKVSGVPYEVTLTPWNPLDYIKTKEQLDEYVTAYSAELERENAMMRARMDRLENELRISEELVNRLNIEVMNLRLNK
jgi:hypothetical protein